MSPDFFALLEYLYLNSASEAMSRSEGFLTRRFYREFSKTYNVSLIEAEKLPMSYILNHVIEGRLDDMNQEELLQYSMRISKTPEEVESEERAMDDLIAKFEKEEEERERRRNEKKPLPEDKEVSFNIPTPKKDDK